MATYITQNDTGEITAQADWKFPDSVQVDYEVVSGFDGRLYKVGEEPNPPEPTMEELYESLRIETERRLADTDKFATVDYPDNALRKKMLVYRAELRAINHQPGAPWDGGGELTPWPELPKT